MDNVLGFDCSNYDDINHLLAECPEAQHVVVRCSLERQELRDIARAQCQAVRDRGLGLSVYLWAYPRFDSTATVAAMAVALVGEFHPDLYWIDCEDTANFYPAPGSNVQWLHGLVAELQMRGCRVGIYTGHWFWTSPEMGDTTEFSDLPLWSATDVKVPDRSLGWAYGGWHPPYAGVQYDLSGPDRDAFDPALFAAAPPPPAPDAPPSDAEQLSYWNGFSHDVLPELIGRLQLLPAATRATAAELRSIIANLQKYTSP